MPPLTLNQAAREAGRSKATLLEAIRSGRFSAPKDELGRYQIDPAELFRVYPPTGRRPDVETATDPLQPTTETALLRQKVELLERIIRGIENERDDLRRRLDAESGAMESAAAEIRRLTLMLTHPPAPEPKAQPTPTANRNDRPAPARPWFWGLFRVAEKSNDPRWWRLFSITSHFENNFNIQIVNTESGSCNSQNLFSKYILESASLSWNARIQNLIIQ